MCNKNCKKNIKPDNKPVELKCGDKGWSWKMLPPCQDPKHDISSLRSYKPGEHGHQCPSCKNVIVFTVWGFRDV
jgi:hypothetical protein